MQHKKHYLVNARLVLLITIGVLAVSLVWYYVGDNAYVSTALHVINVSTLVLVVHILTQTKRRLVTEKYRVQVLESEQARSQSFITETIVNKNNFNHNLANVVAGINHELSPWIGGTIDILARLRIKLEHAQKSGVVVDQVMLHKKIVTVIDALRRSADIMAVVSKNIKHLKLHTNDRSNLKATVESWIGLLFINEVIKRNIEIDQIEVDYKSIDFEITHSPMLLSQVFLNLIKNAIEHNMDRLCSLKIRIYGTELHQLVVEDNGKGVPPGFLHKIFVPEVTTKQSGEIHGLGLSICQEYCKLMCARMGAEHVHGRSGIRFVIDFEAHNGSGLVPIIPE